MSAAAVPADAEAPYAEAWLKGDYAGALKTLEDAGGDSGRELPLDWAVDRAELLFTLGRGDDALAAMEDVALSMQEPWFTVRYAEMLEALGRDSDAEDALQRAMLQSRYNRRPQFPKRNLLAMGRVARMRGENPNRVLQIYQQRLLARFPDFIEGFVEAGELALASYGYDVAEEYFLAAIENAPDRQDALAGLAETYWKADDPRFEEIRERLEALNPHHPRLQGMIAARSLVSGALETAETVLDDILAINPNHRKGLAYRAALAFLRDNQEAQTAALDQLAELDPDRADGYRILGEMAARHYRFGEAVAFLRQGMERDPENVAVQSALGLNLLRLGNDEEGRQILEAAFEQDRFNVEVYNMLEVLDTIENFSKIETGDFRIRLPEQEAGVMGQELGALLAEALARYETAYDVQVEKPVHVQIFDDHDEFMVRSIGLPGNPGHLGICFGNLVTLDSPRARPPRSMNWRAVLWHEFVHVITLQKTQNRIPRWLSEGISVYEEGQRDPAWGQPPQPEFAGMVGDGQWPGVAELEEFFVRPKSPDHLMLGYFLAGEFVQAYVDAYGFPALRDILNRIGDGADTATALTAAAGVSLKAIDEMFAAHLKRACKPLKYLQQEAFPDFLIPKIVTPSFPEILKKGLEAEQAGETADAIEHFEAAAALYPTFPGPENPLRRLAAIHRESGDIPAWSSAVQRLQQHDSAAYEAPHAFLMNAVDRAAWNDVLENAEWCIGIDPFDQSVYEALRQAQEALDQHDGLLETLDVLATLNPDKAADYKLAMSRSQLALGERDAARRTVLEVLEQYPEFRAAQLVLLSLHASGKEENVPDAS